MDNFDEVVRSINEQIGVAGLARVAALTFENFKDEILEYCNTSNLVAIRDISNTDYYNIFPAQGPVCLDCD